MEKFITLRDDTDTLLALKLGPHKFAFLELTDMDDACGRDNEGMPRYVVEVAIVDLDQLAPENIASALQACGWEGMPETPIATAESCYGYGAKAPMFSESGGNRRELIRAGKREARLLASDADEIAMRMERPVNAIGSTANEYMRGDINAAMTRGVLAGRPDACLMARKYKVPQEVIDDARPSDWLPYFFGYIAGHAGHTAETGDEIAPEYYLGFERGQNVRAGKANAPGWIR